jgi:hypothetical protein
MQVRNKKNMQKTQQNCTEDHTQHYTYKEIPYNRANHLTKEQITEDHHQGPHARQLVEGGAGKAPNEP